MEGLVRRPDPRFWAGRRVLLIENDLAVQNAFLLLLMSWGMEVQAVTGVEQARASAAQVMPDLVLTDYRLDAGETGVQALRALARDLGRDLPAVIVSAEAAGLIRAEAGSLAADVLEKPVSEPDLRRAMQYALGQI